jgi:hypothetical protein
MKQGRTLPKLAQELLRQADAKRDFVAEAGALWVRSNGHTELILKEGFAVNEVAHGQLAEYAGIPKGFYDRLWVCIGWRDKPSMGQNQTKGENRCICATRCRHAPEVEVGGRSRQNGFGTHPYYRTYNENQPMNLPVPSPDEVTRFQVWYAEKNGVELSRKEAQATFTDLVQFYFLIGGHEVRDLRTQKHQPRRQAGPIHR